MKQLTPGSTIVWLCIAVAACSSQAPDESPEAAVNPARQPAKIETLENRKTMTTPVVSAEIPGPLMEQLRDDVVAESGIARSSIVTVRAEKVTWRDGSMGCPQPNMMYTQALIPGYWVILRAGREEFDYRATESGKFGRCRSQTKQAPIIYDDNDS